MRANFIGPTIPLDTRRKGNLGEFIALRVAREGNLGAAETFAANAVNPLNPISISGLDLSYFLFNDEDPAKDLLFIQETKTTSGVDLSYGDNLIKDYAKLFGIDVTTTLQTRLQVICNQIELERNKEHLCERVLLLGGELAEQCSRTVLLPTIVHEKHGTNPVSKLLAIREAIASQGWPIRNIAPWSIAFCDLEQRLTRIARGQA